MASVEQTKLYQITEIVPATKDGKASLVEFLRVHRTAMVVASVCMANAFAKKDGREEVAIKWIAKICVQVMVSV